MEESPSSEHFDPDDVQIKYLEDHLKQDLALQKDYEDKLRFADDPKEKERIKRELKDLLAQVEIHQAEYAKLTNGTRRQIRKGDLVPFPEEWVQELPYPIAVKCTAFNAAEDFTARFLALDGLLLNTLKFLAAVALAQYRHDQPQSPQMRTWLKRISRHHLSEWVTMLQEIDQYYQASARDQPTIITLLLQTYNLPITKGSPLDQAYQEITRRMKTKQVEGPLTLRLFLEQLVAYRELTWESGIDHLPPKFAKNLLPILQPAMYEFLQGLTILRSHPIAFADATYFSKGEWVYEMATWRGPEEKPERGKLIHLKGEKTEPPLKQRRLYLCDRENRPLLNLHPLFIHHLDHLYFLESFGEDEDLVFRSCHGIRNLENPEELEKSLSTIYGPMGENQDPCQIMDNYETEVDKKNENLIGDVIARLNEDSRLALENGLGESLRLGHFWLGVEFLLMGLSRSENNGLWELLQNIKLDPGELRGLLRGHVTVRNKDWRNQKNVHTLGAAALPALQKVEPFVLSGQSLQDDLANLTTKPVITPRLLAILQWAVEKAGTELVSPNHLLLAAMQHPQCTSINLLISLMVERQYDPKEFIQHLVYLSAVKPEAITPPDGEQAVDPDAARPFLQPKPPEPSSGRGLLGKLGRDLTALAKNGEINPVVGENAHKAMVHIGRILQQTQSNNPILLGDPGVGKTAIVEGFAYRLARDPKVVEKLAGRRVIDLPVNALMAGTSYRGQLEERLQQLIKEVKDAQGKIIVFIDEIHTILGGKAEGGLGAIADALKPALARGEFPCIGATTVAEYRRYIETDPALARRFSPIWIEEPSVEDAIKIAKGVADSRLAPRHGISYPDETIAEAVHLSVRYIHEEFLPSKAIKLLDEAGPRATMGGSLRGAAAEADLPLGGSATVEIIRQIVAERTGIPLGLLNQSDQQRLRGLEKYLQERVLGQDKAIEAVVRVVKRARTGLADPRRPLGVFLFAGPTGVGKTELALALAEALFDEEKALLRLDMSEFMEKHQVARLVGSPPGYVGYEEEGQLTGRLRRRPYCVVLLDEMEKAHPDVQHLFLQLFDAGRISDARGLLVDGRNAIFIMTTNLDQAGILKIFTAEFRNRLDGEIYFKPLTAELLVAIFDKLFEQVERRFAEKGLQVDLSPEFKARFCADHTSTEFGVRPLERAINDKIVAQVADLLLDGEVTRSKEIEPGFVIRPLPRGSHKGSDFQANDRRGVKPSGNRPKEKGASPFPAGQEENRRSLQALLEALQADLSPQNITLEMDENAWELLCNPKWVEELPDSSIEQAFERLVRKSLMAHLEAGDFHPGDKLKASRNIIGKEFFISFEKI